MTAFSRAFRTFSSTKFTRGTSTVTFFSLFSSSCFHSGVYPFSKLDFFNPLLSLLFSSLLFSSILLHFLSLFPLSFFPSPSLSLSLSLSPSLPLDVLSFVPSPHHCIRACLSCPTSQRATISLALHIAASLTMPLWQAISQGDSHVCHPERTDVRRLLWRVSLRVNSRSSPPCSSLVSRGCV